MVRREVLGSVACAILKTSDRQVQEGEYAGVKDEDSVIEEVMCGRNVCIC